MTLEPDHAEQIAAAARALESADALLVAAGAGMGVDSGLPDFRGNEGFWKAYPPYRSLGLRFEELADPEWFGSDPTLAWGFYGHRLELYRATRPHDGFRLLREWAARMKHGAFVFTSNVDGQFQRAGFDATRVVEVHGAIDWMQCTGSCGVGIFPADDFRVEVDATTMRAREPLPKCPKCRRLARPNILMFGDVSWDSRRSREQMARFRKWVAGLGKARLAIVECGAGTAIPSVRDQCESLASDFGATLIRINPREPDVPRGHIGIEAGALATLNAIDQVLKR